VSVFGLPECHLKPCTHAFRPFWLSPRQIVVIPVAAPFKDYAAKVAQTFHDAGLFAEVDVSDNTLNKNHG
jgi:threonyl-tRNA synthetase